MEKPIRVLVIDDSEDDALLVIRELKNGGGFNPTYEQIDTSEAMSKALDNKSWDAILCDYSMPDFSASAALDLYHEKGLDIPFIIVSGAIADETAVAAMRAGAHDYIMKNNLARLSPAVDRELREAKIRQERRLATDNLRRSEEKYRTLFEDSRDAIYINDAKGDLIDFNQSTMDLFGYSKEELIGMETKTVFVNADEYNRLQESRRPQKGRGKQEGGESQDLGHIASFQLFDEPSHQEDAQRSHQCWEQPDCQKSVSPDQDMYAGDEGGQRGRAEITPVQVPGLSHVQVGIPLESVIGGCEQLDQQLGPGKGQDNPVFTYPC